MSHYIRQFLSLKSVPDILATVGNLGNKPEKEITEAWAIIKKLRKIALKEPKTYQLYDLCSGNALVPVIAAHLLPFKRTFAVDNLPRKRNWSNTRNFEYLNIDIENLTYSHFAKYPTIITGVHCCDSKAEKIIDIFNSVPNIKYIILMPCCIGNLNSSLLQFLKKECGNDIAWITKLAIQIKGKASITRDNFVLSPKNYIITAKKGE